MAALVAAFFVSACQTTQVAEGPICTEPTQPWSVLRAELMVANPGATMVTVLEEHLGVFARSFHQMTGRTISPEQVVFFTYDRRSGLLVVIEGGCVTMAQNNVPFSLVDAMVRGKAKKKVRYREA